MTQIEKRVSELEKALKTLVYTQFRTEQSIFELSEEMKEFKDEMKEFKDEMRRISKDLNKKWGDLANRLGTIVEDLVAPNIPSLIEKYFGLKNPDDVIIRFKRHIKKKGLKKEVDLIVAFHDIKIVFVNETKPYSNENFITSFAKFIWSNRFKEIYYEYEDYQVIPIFSSIYIEEEHIRLCTEKEILAVQIEGDILELKNFEELKDKFKIE